MERKFGIEMEIAGINRQTALRALRAVGISVEDEGYNHTTRRHWKLVSDASVRGGFEVVSPVLEGEARLAEAEVVARALDDAGASVNVSCGLHVHFDAADLSPPISRPSSAATPPTKRKSTPSCPAAAVATRTSTAAPWPGS